MTDPVARLTTALADRYRVERELGQGGMATVWLAEDVKHRRKVAIKVLRPELADVIGPERFLREIETTAQLHHPHILPLYDSGAADGFLYYVMPFMEGESLRQRLEREKQLSIEDALAIAREVADALSYAHALGIVHRDIKPENILLESGHAVVADFGIARAFKAAETDRLTATGTSIGTPVYMSPEQATGESDLDGRSDLYSLACVLYEMLAGQPPFTGATVESVVRQHLASAPRPVTELRPAVPAAVADALARALAKNPADRFSPAAHFAMALQSSRDTSPTAAGVSTRPRAPASTSVLVVAVALLVVGAAVVLMRRSDSDLAVSVGQVQQVTRDAGLEVDPALSPDGQTLAYAAGPTAAMQIYVRQVSGGRPVALTSDSTDNFRWPRWSPDGSQIAYQSNDGIFVVPALGGAARRVARVGQGRAVIGSGGGTPVLGFDWSPDGAQVALIPGWTDGVLLLVSLADGTTDTVPAPVGAFGPAWSPDGTRIALSAGNPPFLFGTSYFANTGVSAIWIVPLDGSEPARLTPDSALNASPQWSASGRELYWTSDREGSRDVYVQRVRGTAGDGPVRRLTVGADAQGLSVTRASGRMAYSRLRAWSSIWSIPVPARGPVSIRDATRLTSGNETIEDLDVSPDGRWLVFDSDRGGNADLYVMPAGGGEARPITDDPAGDFSGDWSPDGRRIAFHSLRSGNRDVYTVEADGTGRRQWTSSPATEELDVDWAPDGEHLLFEVWEGGRHDFETLRLADGAAPEEIVVGTAGDFAHWAPDGRTFVYHAADGLRLSRVEARSDTLLVANAAIGAQAVYAAWAPDGRTLYYLARSPAGWTIRSVRPDGGPSTVLVEFDDPTRQHFRYGLATDGRLFYLTIGSPESDVFVADLETP